MVVWLDNAQAAYWDVTMAVWMDYKMVVRKDGKRAGFLVVM